MKYVNLFELKFESHITNEIIWLYKMLKKLESTLVFTIQGHKYVTFLNNVWFFMTSKVHLHSIDMFLQNNLG